MVDFLDGKLNWGPFIEKKSDFVGDSFWGGCLFAGFATIIMTIVAIVVSLLGFGGIWWTLTHLYLFPIWLLDGLVWMGWGAFWGFYLVGGLLHLIGSFFLWLGNLIASISLVVLYVVIIAAVISAVVWGIAYVLYKFFKTEAGQKVAKYMVFKLNGFSEARKKNVAKRKAIRDAQISKDCNDPYPDKESKKFFLFRMKDWLFDFFFTGKTVVVDGRAYQELGWFALMWQWATALYKGVCPMATVVSKKDPEKE
jgi:hypothetical protein